MVSSEKLRWKRIWKNLEFFYLKSPQTHNQNMLLKNGKKKNQQSKGGFGALYIKTTYCEHMSKTNKHPPFA